MPAPALHPIVIWFGRVGDMILLSALLEVLHRRYGGRCYVIGAGAWPAQLYEAHPDVERISCLHRYTAFALDPAWWRTLIQLRARREDPVYVCEYHPRKLARIRRLLLLSGTAQARCLYITADAAFPAPHWVDRLVGFGRSTPAAFRTSDYPWPSPAPQGAPRLAVAPRARAECDTWLAARGWSTETLILVQPGNRRTMRGRRLRLAADDDKAWPIERWAALLRRINEQLPRARILLCGAPREALLLSWIATATGCTQVSAVELPLPRLLALCARAHSMISVDTGPAHAAAAVGLPLVVLFGAHAQAEWLPRSPTGSPVVGVGGPPQHRRLDEVPMEQVFAAWRALPEMLRPEARATAP